MSATLGKDERGAIGLSDDEPVAMPPARREGTRMSSWPVELLGRRWLSAKSFEVELTRPEGFSFIPGQSIKLKSGDVAREYSLTSGPDDPRLTLCVRAIEGGAFSPLLAAASIGEMFTIHGPHGLFAFKPSPRRPIFVATGAGVAPFLSIVRAGARGFTMLHGAHEAADLYYREAFRAAAARYVSCVTQGGGDFRGRVTDWLARGLSPGSYDFYLCGSHEMVRDVIRLAEASFTGARVYTEVFD